MAFGTFESSRARGRPVSLIQFHYGPNAGDIYAYTDAERSIVRSGITHTPIPVSRDSVKVSGTLDKATMMLSVPHDSEISRLFLVYPPSQVVNMFIWAGHIGDSDDDYRIVWSGRVLSVSREGNEAKLSCEPISTSLKRPGLRRNYQYGCPYVLYGSQCRANKASASVATTVAAISRSYVTVPTTWPARTSTQKYHGGLLEWTAATGAQEMRTILKITNGNVLLLSGPPRNLSVGMSVSVVLGCDHTMSDCESVHGNVQNFGGQPWIPTKNPFGLTSIYY